MRRIVRALVPLRWRARARAVARPPRKPTAAARLTAQLRRDPRRLPPEGLELAFELQRRLRALEDPTGRNRWLHHRWVTIFEQMFDELERRDVLPEPGFTYVCMGAGVQNPYAFSLLPSLAGAEHVWLVEPGGLVELPAWNRIWGLQELALRVLVGDVRSGRFLDRAPADNAFVDLRELFFGDPERALRSAVTTFTGPMEEAPIPDECVDLLSSRSVLEHVLDVESCFDAFARTLKPGGVMYHEIDLTSHTGADRFAFYRDAKPRSRGLNELRLSDYIRGFEQRGFRCHVASSSAAEAPDRGLLQPRFADYDETDLATAGATVIAVKR